MGGDNIGEDSGRRVSPGTLGGWPPRLRANSYTDRAGSVSGVSASCEQLPGSE